jgi:hypothetical protein
MLARFAIALSALTLSGVVALAVLPRSQLLAGVAVGGATLLYLGIVHLPRSRWLSSPGWKEPAVGIVFAAGVSIPLISEVSEFMKWMPGVIAFGGLCWLNCVLIGFWEDGRDKAPPFWSVWFATSISVVALLGAPARVALAVLLSLAALAALHRFRDKLSPRAARVMADFVLLSPLLLALHS